MIQEEIISRENRIHLTITDSSDEAIAELNRTERSYICRRLKQNLRVKSESYTRNHNPPKPELTDQETLILAKIIQCKYSNGWKARGAIMRIIKSFEQEEFESQPKINLKLLRNSISQT